ncbi:MAG: O-antigen ligase family protein [Oscillospiraceae bacterium]|jgi:hypothetical protein
MVSTKRLFSEGLHDPSLFRTVYIVNLFLCAVYFWNVIGVAANIFILIWSLVLFIDMFLAKKACRNIKQGFILAGFLAAGLYTIVLHIDSNFGENFVMLYHAAVCFFLFYGMHSDPNREKVKREIDHILKVIVLLSTLLAVAGLLFVVCAPTGRLYLGGYVFGIMDNRFTGVFTNPNLAAFASVAGMACCHILLKRNRAAKTGKPVLPRWVVGLCFGANGLSLLLSDSNSSLVFAITYIAVYVFCRLYQESRMLTPKKAVTRGVALVLCCALIAGSGLMLRTVCQSVVSTFVTTTTQVLAEDEDTDSAASSSTDDTTVINASTSPDVEKAAAPSVEIGRTDDYDISSGRLDSLKKSLVLFGKFPLMGIGKGNIIPYGEQYLFQGFRFSDLHNGYLTILISNGLIGLFLFMGFLFLFGRRLLRCLRRNRDSDLKELPTLIAALAAYCVFGLFEKAVLFDITFMVVVFWMLLGHTAAFLSQYEWQEDTVDGFASLRVGAASFPSPGMLPLPVYPVPSITHGVFEPRESHYPILMSPVYHSFQQQGHSPPKRVGGHLDDSSGKERPPSRLIS